MKTKLLLMMMKTMMVTLMAKRLGLEPLHMLMHKAAKRHNLVRPHARSQLATLSHLCVLRCTTVLHFGLIIGLFAL